MRVLSYWVLRLLRSPQLWSVKIIFPRWFWTASSESGFYLSSKFNNLITRVWIWAGAHWAHFKIIHLNVQKLIGPHVCMWTLNSFSSHDRTLLVVFEWKLREKKTPIPLTWLNAIRIEFGLVETIDDAIKQMPFICFKASIRFCNQHTLFPLKKCHDMKKKRLALFVHLRSSFFPGSSYVLNWFGGKVLLFR